MLHIGHAAQYGQHLLRCAGKTESPRSHTALRISLLQAGKDMLGNIRQASAQQRFHHHYRNVLAAHLLVQVVGIHVTSRCVLPVGIVQLNLHEVPVHLVVHGQCPVEFLFCTVERPAQVTNTSGFALLEQEVEQTVVKETALQAAFSGSTQHVQQVIVDVVHLQVLQRVVILYSEIIVGIGEVRHFGGDEELVARMTLQGDTCRLFRPALHIDRSRVEIVHAMFDGVIHQPVHFFLIDDVTVTTRCRKCRPAHAAIA